MNRSKLAAAAALLVLGGCAPMGRDFDIKNTRHVTVNVVKGVVSVTENRVDLFENNGAIRWVFGSNPDGYVFPHGGIKFDRTPPAPPPDMGCSSTPDPDSVFKNCKPLDHGDKFQCSKTGPHTVGACFKYDITVEPAGGGTQRKLDPWAKLN